MASDLSKLESVEDEFVRYSESEMKVISSNSHLSFNPLSSDFHASSATEDEKLMTESVDMHARMWTKDYIGLYSHYAAVGFQGGIQGILLNFCVYYFKGSENVCPNAQSIIFLPWSFKVFFAMVTDSYRPFGLRRKPYMIAGWVGVLATTLVLACTAPEIGSSGWILLSIFSMIFLMVADVPADGYSVELGQLEPLQLRGQILATGQRIRFTCTILAGVIQALLVNGPTTNPPDCPISFAKCWKWGLTVSGYYGLIFAILFILFLPILYLKEPDAKNIPNRTFNQHREELWDTMKSLTTLYLIIFVAGTTIFSTMTNIASTYMQYYIIGLTNFQSGIDAVTTFLALAAAIYLFQTFLLNRNWRYTQYGSTIFLAVLGLQWLLVYYDVGNLRNPWFTIFVNTNQQFAQGITQVLYAMAVIELAKPGQEAVTYELIVSVGNAGIDLNTIISTQLLGTVHATACTSATDDYSTCPPTTVDITGPTNYDSTDGPNRFMRYTILILIINLVGMIIFTPFLPPQKAECHEWRRRGEIQGSNTWAGYAGLALAVCIIGYGILSSVMLIDVRTACIPAFGGDGC